jgi:hypothetical protein
VNGPMPSSNTCAARQGGQQHFGKMERSAVVQLGPHPWGARRGSARGTVRDA